MMIHGHYKGKKATRTYRVWNNMKNRCNRPTNSNYAYYGGKGVRVCERWNEFAHFLADMGPAPEGLQLDRINSDGNYEPGNCRWVNLIAQQNNTKKNRRLIVNGIGMTLSEACRQSGLLVGTVWARLEAGWNDTDAATKPVAHPGQGRRGTEKGVVWSDPMERVA